MIPTGMGLTLNGLEQDRWHQRTVNAILRQ